MKKSNYSIPVLLLSFSLLMVSCKSKTSSSVSGDGQTAEFKLNLNKGDKFQTTMEMVQEIETESMGQSMNINQTMAFDFDLEVIEKNNQSNFVIKNTYKRIYMKQSMPGMGAMGETELDTDDPSKTKGMMGSMMLEQFQKFVGKSFNSEHDSKGKIVKTTLNEMMKDITGEEPKDGGMQDFSGYSISYPEKPIKIGESWTGEVKQNNQGMNMVIKSTYTLKSIKDGIAEIEVDGKVSDGNIPEGDNSKGSVSGTQKGTTWVDLKTGWTKESKLNQDMTMEIEQMGMKMPMKLKGTITLKTK